MLYFLEIRNSTLLQTVNLLYISLKYNKYKIKISFFLHSFKSIYFKNHALFMIAAYSFSKVGVEAKSDDRKLIIFCCCCFYNIGRKCDVGN